MEENRADLQELYRELDFSGRRGDRNLIMYAQYRALGYSHSDAIAIVKDEKKRHIDVRNQLLKGK